MDLDRCSFHLELMFKWTVWLRSRVHRVSCMYVCLYDDDFMSQYLSSISPSIVLFYLWSARSADSAPKLIPHSPPLPPQPPCSNLVENTSQSFPLLVSIRNPLSSPHPGSGRKKEKKKRKKEKNSLLLGLGKGKGREDHDSKEQYQGPSSPTRFFSPNCFWGSGRSPAFPNKKKFFLLFFFFIQLTLNWYYNNIRGK